MAKVDEILQKLCDYVYNAGASAKHNGIFVGGEPKKEASQAIKAIISDQVAKARIDETKRLMTISPDPKNSWDMKFVEAGKARLAQLKEGDTK
jgi:hypothetical protein